jgi:hypothetical protein
MSKEIIPAEQIALQIRHFCDPGGFVFPPSADAMGWVSQFVISQISRGASKPCPNSSQSVMSSRNYSGKRPPSYTFTERSAAMLSSMSNNTAVQIAGLLAWD